MGLHTPNTLSEKLLKRVGEYAKLAEDERLVAFYDVTTLGSAKAGLAITDRRMVSFDKDVSSSLDAAAITTITLIRNRAGGTGHRLEVGGPPGTPPISTLVYLNEPDVSDLFALIKTVVGPNATLDTGAVEPWQRQVNRGRRGFILSTTATIEGRPIRDYLGVVSGEAVVGMNFGADLLAGVTDIVGGRSSVFESEFGDAREAAFRMIEDAAAQLGATAVVGIGVDYEVVGATGKMLLVSVNGTAVRLDPEA